MFYTVWSLFLAVLAVSATSPSKTAQNTKRDNVAGSPFISVQGNQFFVNGSAFRFVGTNAYWLSALPTEQDINNTLASIRAANFSVVRTWAFNDVESVPDDNSTWFQLISNGTQTINEGPNGLQKLDKVIELAQNHGLYVLLSLTNNWNPLPGVDQPLPGGFNPIQVRQMPGSNTTLPRNFLSDSYGGMDTYVRNFRGPQQHDQFFTNQTLIKAFMNYTDQIVTRYMNKTSVFAWEIANDPRCNSTLPNSHGCMTQNVTQWHSMIATRINQTDPNHIVSTGNQGFFCAKCPKMFLKPPPTPQSSPAPGFRRSVPEPQSKAKLLKERKAAWKKQRERRKLAGIQADGVKIRGRWTASRTRRQSDLDSTSSAFDGSQGVDSQDIISIPQIGFGSFQFFPDQFDYTQSPPDPSLPPFNQTVETGLNWIKLHADTAKLVNKPVALTGFGLVTQENKPFFVPFNSTEALFGPDSPIPVNMTQPIGVTDDQRDDAYFQWVQAALGGLQGVIQYQWSQGNLTTQPGTIISPNINGTTQSSQPNMTGGSPQPDMTGQSPNDGYGIQGQGEAGVIMSISAASQGIGSDNS